MTQATQTRTPFDINGSYTSTINGQIASVPVMSRAQAGRGSRTDLRA